MKNSLLFLFALLLALSCSKQTLDDQLPVQGNSLPGQTKELGEHILYAGRTINAGLVDYEVIYDYDADGNPIDSNFVVTYMPDNGWAISEAHLYAGTKAEMPKTIFKKDENCFRPKIGLFPYAAYFPNLTDEVVFTVPMNTLPSWEDGGFVVAAHCIVKKLNQQETAWAYQPGDYVDDEGNIIGPFSVPFQDKDWGWYDAVTYWDGPTFPTLLAVTYTDDGYLEVYSINVSTGQADLISRELVGGTSGSYDAAACAVDASLLFFAKNGSELWYSDLTDNTASVQVQGTLMGVPTSATFYGDSYYYVDTDLDIQQVTSTDDWASFTDSNIGNIPSSLMASVSDIAMSPDGDYLYIAGANATGIGVIVSWEVEEPHYFYSFNSTSDDVILEIAFGADGTLYGVAPIDGGGSQTYSITLSSDSFSTVPITINTGGSGGIGGDDEFGDAAFTVDVATGIPE